MTRADLRAAILPLPVFDTHTHLIGGRLAAQDFWDVVEYFWHLRELRAAGYPAAAADLAPADRVAAFLAAWQASANTSMHWVVERIFADLYGLTITDAASVAAADEAVRATATQPGWSAEVTSRLGIERIVVNNSADQPFPELPGAARLVPRLERPVSGWLKQIAAAENQTRAGEEVKATVDTLFGRLAAEGCRGVMTTNSPFGRLAQRTNTVPEALPASGADQHLISGFVLHAMAAAATTHGLTMQLFLGVEGDWGGGASPASDPDRILMLHGLFERWSCPFELVLASAICNLDAVQAARIFPHVRLGGLWWYNFRASSYRDIMQYRMEALPACQAALVVSDARHVEWCYGKILMVKYLLADFLSEQIDAGWITAETALATARWWLHDAAARLYE